ncbi:hypothetical protein FIBSPDRAFT_964633 [Athelia psychrophila]|uniref:Uncharacterized protein n=1 Tax=Athelia psychrophila TaxID=1759441 RepID=A0A165XKT8_9AGAM|nr:hypothetical protein FIBSPDRAFT_964633 [Fibularhizoctonia sp. CBS 109695]
MEMTECASRSAEKARKVATRERAERAKEIEIIERALRYAEKAREEAALERAKRAKEIEIHDRALRSAEKAREVAALEKTKYMVITERALCTFIKPSTNALLDSAGGVHKTCLRAIAKVMRAELTKIS